MTPRASHTALTTNQNWSGSSFPTPLNMSSLIALTMLKCGSGGCGVGGGGNCEMCCLIKLTTLLGETLASSSLLSREGEYNGLFSKSLLLL